MEQRAPTRQYSIEEYFQFEENSVQRHEYRDGQIVAMAGGTYDHSLISANVIGELYARLKGKPCRLLESNLRIGITSRNRITYPDASVICGPPQFHPDDKKRSTVINPRLIIEVLSESTEAYDRGKKFELYRELDSLQEYALVSQNTAQIETFFRASDGGWRFDAVHGRDAIARLRSIELDVPLLDIYAGVEFQPPPPPPEEARVEEADFSGP